VAILCEEPERLQQEPLSKVRITISEFESLDKEQRMRLLIDELQRATGSGQKHGAEKFEVILDRFGLAGPIDPDVKKDMRELQHVRNVIVHRASRADRRLVEACPWMDLKIGDAVKIRHDDFMRYYAALEDYLGLVVLRLGLAYDIDYSDLVEKLPPRVQAVYQQMVEKQV
jgi:hypothetical protein